MEKVIIFSFLALATTFADPYLHHPYVEDIVLPSQDVSVPYPYHTPLPQNLGLKFYGEDHGLLDATTDVVDSKLRLGFSLIPTVIYTVVAFVSSGAFAVIKAIVVSLLTKLPKLLIGGIVGISICKLTPICSKLSHFTSVEEVVSFATPERITRAAQFVEKAVHKFSAMQDSFDKVTVS